MKVYYKDNADNNESMAYIDLEGQMPINNNGAPNQIILSTWVFDTDAMMSNEAINHLLHVMYSGTPIYIDAAEVDYWNGTGMVPVETINIIKDLDCLKLGAALIVFQLIPKG